MIIEDFSKYTDEALLDAYISFRSSPSNDNHTDGMWCESHMVPLKRMVDIKASKAYQEEFRKILDVRRKNILPDLLEIDRALIERAKNGDHKAIQLVWARYEGWSPKIAESNSKLVGKTKTLADLMVSIEEEEEDDD